MGPDASRRERRHLITAATLVASLTLVAGAGAGGGGVDPPKPPKLTDVRCLESCAGGRKAVVGSKVELAGSRLEDVRTVSFDGAEDRIEVDPISSKKRAIKAHVPDGAETGRPQVDGRSGSDTSPQELTIVAEEELPEPGAFKLDRAEAKPATAFYDGAEAPEVRYAFEGEPTDIRVQVAKRKSGKVIRSWVEPEREPFVEHTARWNGQTEGGKKAPDGKYRFHVGPAEGGELETTEESKFGYYGHKFPVRGPHSYGDGMGAGRGHQGQDVFAACGTRLEAARGGRVQWRQYHSAAGYYIVIDGKGTGRDYAYMHMRRKGRPSEGERVHTGERIGYVSDTGNATGCHLHFELWSAPGWYKGGSAVDPLPRLRAWDAYS